MNSNMMIMIDGTGSIRGFVIGGVDVFALIPGP
jgi:hypothetical protein